MRKGEKISIDFHKLNSKVQKIVFVLTINEALEKRLDFGMLNDAYIRMIGQTSGESYQFKWHGNSAVTVIIQPSERKSGIRVGID